MNNAHLFTGNEINKKYRKKNIFVFILKETYKTNKKFTYKLLLKNRALTYVRILYLSISFYNQQQILFKIKKYYTLIYKH
jgi:hypothetical protein